MNEQESEQLPSLLEVREQARDRITELEREIAWMRAERVTAMGHLNTFHALHQHIEQWHTLTNDYRRWIIAGTQPNIDEEAFATTFDELEHRYCQLCKEMSKQI